MPRPRPKEKGHPSSVTREGLRNWKMRCEYYAQMKGEKVSDFVELLSRNSSKV